MITICNAINIPITEKIIDVSVGLCPDNFKEIMIIDVTTKIIDITVNIILMTSSKVRFILLILSPSILSITLLESAAAKIISCLIALFYS